MQRKIPEEKKEQVRKLYGDGLAIRDISRQTGISYASVYCLTRAKERGFNSYCEYQEHLAKKRGFNSRCEYEEELAEKRSWRKKNKRFSRALKMFLSENGQ